MRYVLHRLPYANKDVSRIRPLDLLLVGRAHVVYERGERHDNPLIWYGQGSPVATGHSSQADGLP
jgi:hypothetical protein